MFEVEYDLHRIFSSFIGRFKRFLIQYLFEVLPIRNEILNELLKLDFNLWFILIIFLHTTGAYESNRPYTGLPNKIRSITKNEFELFNIVF